MSKLLLIGFMIFAILPCTAFAQSNRPAVVFQTVFSRDYITSSFRFSSGNKYLYGYNEEGEYILWDIRTAKQIKKISPPSFSIPALLYFPDPDFSKDEKYLLIPEFPKGNYFLYDVESDKNIFTFIPPLSEKGERYTNAKFSKDRKAILLLSQSTDNNICVFRLVDFSGRILKTCNVSIPRVLDNFSGLVQLAFNKVYKGIQMIIIVKAIAVSPSLQEIYFATVDDNLYKLNMEQVSDNTTLTEPQLYKTKALTHSRRINALSLLEENLLVLTEDVFTELPQKKLQSTDTIYALNKHTLYLEKKIISRYVHYPVGERSNSVNTSPVLTNTLMNLYVDFPSSPDNIDKVVFKDIKTDIELFSFERGQAFHWYNDNEYEPGKLNGGSIVAISDDRKLMAVCSKDMIIYDTESKKIKSYFSLKKGNFRLNQPIFLDSSRILIPKIYNDAFVYDLKGVVVERLKRERNCQDTAHLGGNVFFSVEPTASMGLQNVSLSATEKKIMLVNYIPYDLCHIEKNKCIEIWTSDKLEKLETYNFKDAEFTYHASMIPGEGHKFLVNYKLVDFDSSGQSTVKELKIIEKKDTFLAVNPVYRPASKSIFTIMGTRTKPGNRTLFFVEYSIEGKLLKSFKFKREKNKLTSLQFITESQLSPNGDRLLFCLSDGTAGIFDIPNMQVLHLFEHGQKVELKIANFYMHTTILSGCFTDNDHFVTCGDEGAINIWSVNEDKPQRAIQSPGNSYLLGIGISPDKRYLFGTNMDKNIVFINLETGKSDLVFTAFDYENYAMTTSDGYYMTNKKSNNEISFLYKGSSYDFSQFDLSLNRPDKILKQMGYARPETISYLEKAYEKRVEKLGYKPMEFSVNDNYTAPVISFSGLPTQTITTDSSISFNVIATDANYIIDRLFISVNGVPQYGSNGLPLKQKVGGSTIVPVKIPLSFGKNQVVVSVLNNQAVESLKESVFIERKGTATKPNLYIVAIGSGLFTDTSKNLTYPAKDATDILNLFDEKAKDYSKINKMILTNAKVTRAALKGLKTQLKSSRPDDVVILFYAGHGILDNKLNYYLSTFNTNFANPGSQAISYDELESLLDSIPSRNKILLIDACHSGETDKETVKEHFESRKTINKTVFGVPTKTDKAIGSDLDNSFNLMKSLFSDLRRTTGTSVLAAAGSAQYAGEYETLGNGVFTFCLRTGLKEKKADLDKDGKILLSELLEYLQTQVKKLTNGQQQPTSRTENLVNDIRVW